MQAKKIMFGVKKSKGTRNEMRKVIVCHCTVRSHKTSLTFLWKKKWECEKKRARKIKQRPDKTDYFSAVKIQR